jgi:hypothetical protein
MRAGTLGRSYAQECVVVRVGLGEGLGFGLSGIMGTCDGRGMICCCWAVGGRGVGDCCGGSGISGMMCTCGMGNVVAKCTCGCGGGAMLTRHSRAPVGSRVPVRICLPELSWTSRRCLSMNAVQPASHSLPS